MKKSIYYFLFALIPILAQSCVDDEVITPQPTEEKQPWVDPNMPEEIRNGYSISFNMELPPMDGATRTTGVDILDIDNFVDLEKVRILFFVCADSPAGNNKVPTGPADDRTSYADTTYAKYVFPDQELDPNRDNYRYMTGENDHFLFESKSRWVANLTGESTNNAQWQVTAPVFTYGNNDEYRWEDIRYALTHYPFKVVVLANRPDQYKFGNFDGKFSKQEVEYDTGRGPVWGPDQTWVPFERRTQEGDKNIDWDNLPTINDLHHCQWDVVYASKNTGDKYKGESGWTDYANPGVYDFIMKNPDHDISKLEEPDHDNPKDSRNKRNLMGALSSWTKKKLYGTVEKNSAFLPNKTTQAIPMYGCQVFDPVPDWAPGTPFNISERHHGQSGQLIRKNIFLLRSLVKLELIIPKWMKNKNGEYERIIVSEPTLRYSNVMARCEPLDVATPTERIWHEENWNLNEYCEWKTLSEYGPIINGDLGAGTLNKFHERVAWFYGAWRDWWHFNYGSGTIDPESEVTTLPSGLDPNSNYFKPGKMNGKAYPRIFNPVVQRNDEVRIDECLIESTEYEDEDDKNAVYHYVVYTGERHINDPTTFGQSNSFNKAQAQVAYFRFMNSKNGQTYYIPLSEYKPNSKAATKHFTAETGNSGYTFDNYRADVAQESNPDDWNIVLLRNHTYTFQVVSLPGLTDDGPIDVKVVSTEKRYGPSIWFY